VLFRSPEKEEKEETKEANKGEEQRNRNNILHTNEGEETNNDGNNNDDDSTTFMHLLYKVAFTSIVLLDGSNNVFLIKHRSGEWTPPGGKIEKNENSLEAAKREYQEETGVSIDALLSKGILESIGIFLFFHPESVRKSAKKERKQVSRKKKKIVRVRILCLVVFWVPSFGSRRYFSFLFRRPRLKIFNSSNLFQCHFVLLYASDHHIKLCFSDKKKNGY
jgi:8-oxo-dGTP pyrophosphatase MutT (NUDIX family)